MTAYALFVWGLAGGQYQGSPTMARPPILIVTRLALWASPAICVFAGIMVRASARVPDDIGVPSTDFGGPGAGGATESRYRAASICVTSRYRRKPL